MSVTMLFRSLGGFEPWTWFASLGIFAFLQQFIPLEYTDGMRRNLRLWIQSFTPYIFCDVHEYDNSIINMLYPDIEIYLSSLTAQAAQRLRLSKSKNSKKMTFNLANDQRTEDNFENAKIEWVHSAYERNRPMWTASFESQSEEKRTFTMQIGRKDKRLIDKYMAHIQARAEELKRAARDLLLYTNSKGRDSYYPRRSPWESINFVHPATFDTLALDGDLKTRICDDLDKFANGEAYYRRVGKAWKRGYLLYGPPGTGKSSMIAAIANKMRYDVYDLELTEVDSNIELRKLLLHTNNKSVIVIEDIDCSLDLSGQRKKKKKKPANEPDPANPTPMRPQKEQSKVTLSGLLNFVDGLWSSCGSERIFIFTTNYAEKLDPALLRAGRMDMHINLSYCTFSAFQVLAKNYLQITDHELFGKLRTSFGGSYMTPAAVSEVLIRNQDCATAAIEDLLAALDEHRIKPKQAPPDSDDEKEDEKDVVELSAGPGIDRKDKVTTTTDDGTTTATDIKEQKEGFQEKQVSQGEKAHPDEDQVEFKGETTTATNNFIASGNAESGTDNVVAGPSFHANDGAAGLQHTSAAQENGDTAIHLYSNGLVSLSNSVGKEDIIVNGDAGTITNDISSTTKTTSNGVVSRKHIVGDCSEKTKGVYMLYRFLAILQEKLLEKMALIQRARQVIIVSELLHQAQLSCFNIVIHSKTCFNFQTTLFFLKIRTLS